MSRSRPERQETDRIEVSELTSFLSTRYGVPSTNLYEFEIAPEILALVPKDTAEKHQFIPVKHAAAPVCIATADPSITFAIGELKSITGYNIKIVVTSHHHRSATLFSDRQMPDDFFDGGVRLADLVLQKSHTQFRQPWCRSQPIRAFFWKPLVSRLVHTSVGPRSEKRQTALGTDKPMAAEASTARLGEWETAQRLRRTHTIHCNTGVGRPGIASYPRTQDTRTGGGQQPLMDPASRARSRFHQRDELP